MLKNTSFETEKEIYTNLEKATEAIKEVAQYVNSKKQEFENLSKMTQIQAKLGMKDLVIPSRTFIKSEERADKIKRIRDKDNSLTNVKSLYLFSDLIICIAERKNIGVKMLKIPLQSTSKDKKKNDSNPIYITKLDKDSLYNGFKVVNINHPPSLDIVCEDEKTQDEWIKLISEQIEIKRDSIAIW
jgi:hypothetical protein